MCSFVCMSVCVCVCLFDLFIFTSCLYLVLLHVCLPNYDPIWQSKQLFKLNIPIWRHCHRPFAFICHRMPIVYVFGWMVGWLVSSLYRLSPWMNWIIQWENMNERYRQCCVVSRPTVDMINYLPMQTSIVFVRTVNAICVEWKYIYIQLTLCPIQVCHIRTFTYSLICSLAPFTRLLSHSLALHTRVIHFRLNSMGTSHSLSIGLWLCVYVYVYICAICAHDTTEDSIRQWCCHHGRHQRCFAISRTCVQDTNVPMFMFIYCCDATAVTLLSYYQSFDSNKYCLPH